MTSATVSHHPIRSISSEAYIGFSEGGQSRKTIVLPNTFIGDLEYKVLSHFIETGLQRDTLSSIAKSIGVDVRRVYDALARLLKRGFVSKLARGLYRITEEGKQAVLKLQVRKLSRNISRRPSQGKPDGTRVLGGVVGGVCGGVGVGGFGLGFGVVGGGLGVFGPFFDNVRGVVGGVFVGGDRGRVRGLGELVFFERVSYVEVLYRVSGFVLPGQLVVYSNAAMDGVGVRVEWRPPGGFVRGNGVGSALRLYWWVVLSAARVFVELLLREAPWDVKRLFLRFVSMRLGSLVCV